MAVISSCGVTFAQPTIPATLFFHILDSEGSPVDYKVASLTLIGQPDVELAAKVKDMVFDAAVLGGTYECVIAPVKAGSGFTQSAKVTVTSLRTVAVISVYFDALDFVGGALNTFFVVKPSPVINNELTWVAVRPAFSTDIQPVESAIIDRNGRFTLDGLHGGAFLVTFYRGSKILATKVMEIPRVGTAAPIEIRIE
jgi:hypothetical protein